MKQGKSLSITVARHARPGSTPGRCWHVWHDRSWTRVHYESFDDALAALVELAKPQLTGRKGRVWRQPDPKPDTEGARQAVREGWASFFGRELEADDPLD